MKHFLSVLLAAMSITAGIAGNVSKCDHWKAAVFFWCLCGLLAILACIAGFVENIPKPHIVPVGYGQVGESYTVLGDGFDGLLFENDGEPAYNVMPPNPTRFGRIGDPMLVFDDPGIGRLTREQGARCFPVAIKDSGGVRLNDLRMQLALSGSDFVLISFQYADGRKPQRLCYTTVCKIELHSKATKGLKVTLFDYKINWLRIFWGRE
jgi:hypothetical protein